MPLFGSSAALGLAAVIGSSTFAAPPGSDLLQYFGLGDPPPEALKVEFHHGRDLVLVGKSTDLQALLKKDPLAVLLSLPQHGRIDLAREAAFQYALSEFKPGADREVHCDLLDQITNFSNAPQRDAVLEGIKKATQHVALLSTLPGLDGDPTNRVSFYRDAALQHVVEVHTFLQQLDPTCSGKTALENSIQIARNLYLSGSDVTRESVRAAHAELFEARARYYGIQPFEGRAVILAAHAEKLTEMSSKADADEHVARSGDVHRFGKDALQYAIESEACNGGSLATFRAENIQELELVKARILHAIEYTPRGAKGFTFVFDGHGGPDMICLGQGEHSPAANLSAKKDVSYTIGITSSEFAEALQRRAELYPESAACTNDAARDIVIVVGCFSQDFIRNLAQRLKDTSAAPLLVSACEYSQYSYSELSSPLGSAAFDHAFPRANIPNAFELYNNWPFRSCTLGDLLQLGVFANIHPSIFVPAPPPDKDSKEPAHYRQIGMIQIGEELNTAGKS